jgi:hypothetical protein
MEPLEPAMPPLRTTSTGLIIGLAVGGGLLAMAVVATLGIVFVVAVAGAGAHRRVPVAGSVSPSDDGGYPYDTYSPTPSPSPTSRSDLSLDSVSTDDTPLTGAQVFPERTVVASDGTTYTYATSGAFSACDDAGGDATDQLMRAHGCGSMLVGDYSNDPAGLLVSVMVIPLPSSSDAGAVVGSLNQLGDAFDELTYYCPQDVSYHDTLCGDGATRPSWSEISVSFHRYVILSTALEENGSDTPRTEQVKDAVNAIATEVETAIPVIA